MWNMFCVWNYFLCKKGIIYWIVVFVLELKVLFIFVKFEWFWDIEVRLVVLVFLRFFWFLLWILERFFKEVINLFVFGCVFVCFCGKLYMWWFIFYVVLFLFLMDWGNWFNGNGFGLLVVKILVESLINIMFFWFWFLLFWKYIFLIVKFGKLLIWKVLNIRCFGSLFGICCMDWWDFVIGLCVYIVEI